MESASLSNVKDMATRLFVTLKGNVRDGFASVTETLRQKATGSRGPSVKELLRDKANIVHLGFLRKRSSQPIQKHYKWKYFYVVIAHEHIYYYKDEFADHPAGSFSLSGYIDARTATSDAISDVVLPDRVKKWDSDEEQESENVPYSFIVIPQGSSLMKMQRFAAQSEEECKMWTEKVKAAVKEARDRVAQGASTLPLASSSRASQEKDNAASNQRSTTLGRVTNDKVIMEKQAISDNESDPEDYLELDDIYLQPKTQCTSYKDGDSRQLQTRRNDNESPGTSVSISKSMNLPHHVAAALLPESPPPPHPLPIRETPLVSPVSTPARRPLPETPPNGMQIQHDNQTMFVTDMGNESVSIAQSEAKVGPKLQPVTSATRRLPPPPLHAPPPVSVAGVSQIDTAGVATDVCVPEVEARRPSNKPAIADRAPALTAKGFLSDKTSTKAPVLGRSSTSAAAYSNAESGGELAACSGAPRSPAICFGSADEIHQPKTVRLPVGAVNVMLPLGDRGKAATLPSATSNPTDVPRVLGRTAAHASDHTNPVKGEDDMRMVSGGDSVAQNRSALQTPKASEPAGSPRLQPNCLVTTLTNSAPAASAATVANSKSALHEPSTANSKAKGIINASNDTQDTSGPLSAKSPNNQPMATRQFPPPPIVQVTGDSSSQAAQKASVAVTSAYTDKAESLLPIGNDQKLLKPATGSGPSASPKLPRQFPPPPSPKQQEKNSQAVIRAQVTVKYPTSSTYYWGGAKDTANRALKESRNEDGVFLIRDSSDPQTKVLCVTALGQTHSLKVYQRSLSSDSDTWSFTPITEGVGDGSGNGGAFKSLDELIAHHQKEPILIRGGTLALKLTRGLTFSS